MLQCKCNLQEAKLQEILRHNNRESGLSDFLLHPSCGKFSGEKVLLIAL